MLHLAVRSRIRLLPSRPNCGFLSGSRHWTLCPQGDGYNSAGSSFFQPRTDGIFIFKENRNICWYTRGSCFKPSGVKMATLAFKIKQITPETRFYFLRCNIHLPFNWIALHLL